jgi:alpha-tubulin suppressor-like RCC1 family protein
MEDVAAVSAGFFHTMAITADGRLWSWGVNLNGLLGDESIGDLTAGIFGSPTPVHIMNDVVYVAARDFHTLALRADGSLWAWGANFHGQLGDGTTEERHTPVRILTDAVSVTAGASHTLATKSDGSLWAWGWNRAGQLGDGTTIDSLIPIKIQEKYTDGERS